MLVLEPILSIMYLSSNASLSFSLQNLKVSEVILVPSHLPF